VAVKWLCGRFLLAGGAVGGALVRCAQVQVGSRGTQPGVSSAAALLSRVITYARHGRLEQPFPSQGSEEDVFSSWQGRCRTKSVLLCRRGVVTPFELLEGQHFNFQIRPFVPSKETTDEVGSSCLPDVCLRTVSLKSVPFPSLACPVSVAPLVGYLASLPEFSPFTARWDMRL
jgi:hypothetical protein